jgi:hypothetical protein
MLSLHGSCSALRLDKWRCMPTCAAASKGARIIVAATKNGIKKMLHSEKHRSRKRRPFSVPVNEFDVSCETLHQGATRKKNEAAALMVVREFRLP